MTVINSFQTLGTKLSFLTIFFAKQFPLIENANEIPAILNIKTTKTLSSIPVSRAGIAKIIKNLDPNKAQGHDMISIRMLKVCDDSVLPPLELIFKSCLKVVHFPHNEKKQI